MVHLSLRRIDQVQAGMLSATVRSLSIGSMECYAAVDGAEETQDFQQLLAGEEGRVIAEPIGRVRETMIFRLRQRGSVQQATPRRR